MRTVVVFLVALLVASCADRSGGGTPGPRIEVRTEFDDSGGVYIEGFLSYVRVRGPGIDEEIELEVPESASFELEGGGTYVMTSWVRSCAGNCGFLDPPSDRCEDMFAVGEGATLRVLITYRAGTPCEIEG
jgi:hypothetical protein